MGVVTTEPKRQIGVYAATAITVGNIIGSGIFRWPLSVALEIASFNVYAVTKDGKRFLVAKPQPAGVAPLTVIVNWQGAISK
jgi:hypothetical protein